MNERDDGNNEPAKVFTFLYTQKIAREKGKEKLENTQ
jgi:hypothetical protein